MNKILAYGDSNTWGFDPRTKDRYDKATRWTGILQSRCKDAMIVEEGLNGRTTVFDDPTRPGRNGLETLLSGPDSPFGNQPFQHDENSRTRPSGLPFQCLC